MLLRTVSESRHFPWKSLFGLGSLGCFWSYSQNTFTSSNCSPPQGQYHLCSAVRSRFHSEASWIGPQKKKKKKSIRFFGLFAFPERGINFKAYKLPDTFQTTPFPFYGVEIWKFLAGICGIRQVCLSFVYTIDANELEMRIPTGQLFNNFCLLSGEQTHSESADGKYAYVCFAELAVLDFHVRLLTPCKSRGAGSKWSLTSVTRELSEVCAVYSTCLWKCETKGLIQKSVLLSKYGVTAEGG